MSITSERNSDIIHDYTSGRTALELSRTYGLSEPRIRQIVSGVKKTKRLGDKRPISDAHRRLGMAVYDFRFDNQMTRRSVAARLGWSVAKLFNMEQGFIDPTLLDLQDLASFMKRNLGELLDNVLNRQQTA